MQLFIILTILFSLQTANAGVIDDGGYQDCNTQLVPQPTLDITSVQEPYINQRINDFKVIAEAVQKGDHTASLRNLNKMSEIFTAFRGAVNAKVAYFTYNSPAIYPLTVDVISTYSTLIAALNAMVTTAKATTGTLTGTKVERAINILPEPAATLAAFRTAVLKITGNRSIASQLDRNFTKYLTLVVGAMTKIYAMAKTAITELMMSLLKYFVGYHYQYLKNSINPSTHKTVQSLQNYKKAGDTAFYDLYNTYEPLLTLLPSEFGISSGLILDSINAIKAETIAIVGMLIKPYEQNKLRDIGVITSVKRSAIRVDTYALNFVNAVTELINFAEGKLTREVVFVLAYLQNIMSFVLNDAYNLLEVASQTIDHGNSKPIKALLDYETPLKTIESTIQNYHKNFDFTTKTDFNKVYRDIKSLLTASTNNLKNKIAYFNKLYN